MAYRLFEVAGVEIEYALVRRGSLEVFPGADRLLAAMGGSPDTHPALGNVEADNELAAHVLELKCREPTRDLAAQAGDFQAYVAAANKALEPFGAMLFPTGTHPFMDPARESKLWEHEDREIYEAYDRAFDCRGHGWFNLQSVHLNLPFSGDVEFSRLHNAISLLLPVLPALAASSPIFDGEHQGWLDSRLMHYMGNQRRLPAILGNVVPEPVESEQEYRDKILAPMYRQIAPFDPDGLLRDEWLNSRAAIARFDRNAIEIRCLDTQENPRADLALCHWVTLALRHMLDTGEDMYALHRSAPAALLKSLFTETARLGGSAGIPGHFPFAAFGLEPQATVSAFLKALTARILPGYDGPFGPCIDLILREGNLAERILKAAPAPAGYGAVYAELCECLGQGKPFTAIAPVRTR